MVTGDCQVTAISCGLASGRRCLSRMRKPSRASRVLFMCIACDYERECGRTRVSISGVAFQGLWYGSMVKGTLIKHAVRLVRSSYCILLLVLMSWEQPAIHALHPHTTPCMQVHCRERGRGNLLGY